MKAMILAAGRGERMRPLTDTTPKPLLTVDGKPLIVWVIERLKRAGVMDLVVNVSHLAEQIESALGDGARFGARIAYSFEHEVLETAGGIAWALPQLDHRPFLVVNSDVYSDYDFAGITQRAQTLSANQPAHLVLVNNPAHHPQGDFGLREGNVIAGITRGDKARLAAQLATPIAEGRVSGEHFRGEWNDVGTPQRLAELDARLRENGIK